jgi:hypothetical protein
MATKDQVIFTHKLHPDWSSQQIADKLDCDSAYVRATFKRNGLKSAPRITRSYIVALGEAAHMAGLTIRDLETLARIA